MTAPRCGAVSPEVADGWKFLGVFLVVSWANPLGVIGQPIGNFHASI